MSEKVKVKKVYENKKGDKTWYNVYLTGKEGKFTTWNKVEEGKEYNVDIWEKGGYMNMKISEDPVERDVYDDIQEKAKPISTNHSIESQVILKGTVDIICALIEKDLIKEENLENNITIISTKLTDELKNTQKQLLISDNIPEEITVPEAF